MRRWFRAYQHDRDGLYALRYIWTALISVVGLWPLLGVASASADGRVGLVGFVTLWQVAVWRSALVGVYVGDFGVKVRMLVWTRVLPWSRIEHVWAGPAAHDDAWQIWITVRDPKRDIQTPIRRTSNRWYRDFFVKRNCVRLAPNEFAAVLATLDPRLSAFNPNRPAKAG